MLGMHKKEDFQNTYIIKYCSVLYAGKILWALEHFNESFSVLYVARIISHPGSEHVLQASASHKIQRKHPHFLCELE